ncbi:MAG: Ig-like domain-containing protein [Bacillota bacterium]|nr:Ig-like domain-containing protein [Bacillota bacterium]
MKKIFSILIVLVLCLGQTRIVHANEQEETVGLTDYTELFFRENPEALREKEGKKSSNFSIARNGNTNYAYLAVFIEFPDMEEFDMDSKETVKNANIFFNDTSEAYSLMDHGKSLPLLSFKKYIQKYSYGKADVTTYMFPNENGKVLSYVAPQPQAYYKEKSSTNPIGYDNSIFEDGKGNVVTSGGIKQQWAREFALLNGAIEYVDKQISLLGLTSEDIDIDGDGKVDSISFFCEAGDYASYNGSYVYNSLLWSHKLSGCTRYMHTILGKNVSFYNLILSYDSNKNAPYGNFSMNNPTFGTVIHEFFHILGLPDLYRTSYQSQYPVGYYDVMALNNKVIPQPTLTYNVSGEATGLAWHDPLSEINKTSRNVILEKPKYLDSSEQNAVKIMVPGLTDQFFVAEYYEQSASSAIGRGDSSGAIIYRVNTQNVQKGNTLGYKGGQKDFIYVMRPGDTLNNEGNGQYLAQAILSENRESIGKFLVEDADFDGETLYLADGSNSGIVISVVDQDFQSITLDITYTNPIVSLQGEFTSLSLQKGEQKTLAMRILPEDTTMSKDLVWESSNSKVAEVDEYGTITALSSGEAIIRATTINGITASISVKVSALSVVPIYRLYNEQNNVHCYVANNSEKEGWEQEGTAWYAPEHSDYPVYQFVNESGQYLYSMDSNRVSNHWKNEGIAFYSDPSESIPIYVLKKNTDAYYYTKDFKEYNALSKKGWTRCGIAWYGTQN